MSWTPTARRRSLLGLPVETPAALYEATRLRTAEQVRDAVAAAVGEAIVLLPGETSLDRDGYSRLVWSSRPVPAVAS